MRNQIRHNGQIGVLSPRSNRIRWIGAILLALLIILGVLLGPHLLSLYQQMQQQLQASEIRGANSLSGQEPAQEVNPFIGTEPAPQNLFLHSAYDSGNVFPGAAYPHGMVQWSPDTTTAAGGYRYNQSIIDGFSLTHFSGRGCAAYQDFPFLPVVGALKAPFHFSNYATSFSHQHESAMPGYYSVLLPEKNISVALTVTPRTGLGRFTYPATSHALMLINAGGSATGDAQSGTGIQIVGNNEVTGEATSGHFCASGQNVYTLYFAAQFDQPFTASGTWQGTHLHPGSNSSSGRHSGAYLTFDTTQRRELSVKVGLSFVSVSNAQANLAQENAGWDFSPVSARARAAWNSSLGQVQIAGGGREPRQIFYTALYHTLLHPNIFSDVNGQYPGFDGKIHVAQGYTQYENFPGWDMYRSLIALRALLEPQVVGNMLQSLVADAQQGGGGLPRWEVANDNSGGMVGDSMDAVIATSYAFGVRNFNAQAALHAMDLGASSEQTRSGRYPTRENLHEYRTSGYVHATTVGSASITLEYAVDDFAIAQFAGALGEKDMAARYLKRSHNWSKLFNRQTGYLVPRNADGSFLHAFQPQSSNGFIEGDSAQYTWMVPEDLPGLFAQLGGNAQVVKRLDQHFQHLNAGPSSSYAWMGNEPEFGVPWLYDFANRPDRSEAVVRTIETQLFHATPDGLPGNDDGGAMSSWYVFAAMGLYPEIPGMGGFALGSPLFPSLQLHRGNDSMLTISGQGAAEHSPYVQSLSLNGRSESNPWLPYSAIQSGGTLAFVLGTQANTSWSTPIQTGQLSAG
jgi:predicted alpha-1,2-mannosidase